MSQSMTIEILAINVKSGTAAKSGKPYSLPQAQCMITNKDGLVKVGELILPESLANTPKGVYNADTAFDVDMAGKVITRVISLQPVRAAKAA